MVCRPELKNIVMSNSNKVATSNAKEEINVATATSTNLKNKVNMRKDISEGAVVAPNETSEETCCPKSKTTVRAIINGEEVEVTLARTIYSMDKLKKNQEKLLEDLDKSKLLDEIFHFCTPEIFINEGIELLDWNGETLAEDTEHVLIPVETAGTYWRFTTDDVLKNVQVHKFESVEEYAQVIGASDLFSRSRNTVEKIGVAALATSDETYKAVYELSRRTGMPGSTAMAYLGVQLKGTTTLEMSMGLKRNEIPVITRTYEEAFALYQQICFTFTPAEAKKRYPIRAVNSVMHAGGYQLETIMLALKTLPSDDVNHALVMDCGVKESCISSMLLKFIIEKLNVSAA
jgi:hypothetical protein